MGWGALLTLRKPRILPPPSPVFPSPSFFWPSFLCAAPPPVTIHIHFLMELLPSQRAKIESLSLGTEGNESRFYCQGGGKGKDVGWGPGLLHRQAERVDGEGKASGGLSPSRVCAGRTDDTETTRWGGEVTTPPELCSGGVWWEGTAMRSRSWDGVGYRLQILRKGAGRGGGEASIAFCSQFCGRRGGGGLGLDTPCPPWYPLGDGCW